MQSGGGKSTLFMIEHIRSELGLKDNDPSWVFEDASFEKMGALMRENSCRLLGFTMAERCQIRMNWHCSCNYIMVIPGEETQVTKMSSLDFSSW